MRDTIKTKYILMKRRSIQFILLPGFLWLLLGCTAPESPKRSDLPALKVTEDYTPPKFDDPDRNINIADALNNAHLYYQEAAGKYHLPGVAYGVVVDDSLVFSGGFGITDIDTQEAVTEHSLFRIASMTKSFTAMAILKLRDEGKLSLDDQVSDYLPALEELEYPTRDATPITLFNLLTMTAGFPEDNPWGDRFLDISNEELMDQVAKGIPFSTVPSQQYEYSNLGYGLLGQVISFVTGVPYQEYITKNILESLGMKDTYWEYSKAPEKELALGYRWERDGWMIEPILHDGAFGAMGGLITSITDFSKYVSLHLSAWPPRNDPDRGPLKRSSLREMHQMNHPRIYTDQERFHAEDPLVRGYGFGLVSMKDQQGFSEVGHNGGLPGFGSSYMFYPEHGIGIMAFSNLTYVGSKVRSANYRVIESLMDQDLFHPRTLPASNILIRRKEEVARMLLEWDPVLEKEIVAENLYLDISREKRMLEAREHIERAGKIISIGPVEAENQLRGSFVIHGNKGRVKVYFTLSPEAKPRVQWITLEFISPEE